MENCPSRHIAHTGCCSHLSGTQALQNAGFTLCPLQIQEKATNANRGWISGSWEATNFMLPTHTRVEQSFGESWHHSTRSLKTKLQTHIWKSLALNCRNLSFYIRELINFFFESEDVCCSLILKGSLDTSLGNYCVFHKQPALEFESQVKYSIEMLLKNSE